VTRFIVADQVYQRCFPHSWKKNNICNTL
jgi:hypothetical protein